MKSKEKTATSEQTPDPKADYIESQQIPAWHVGVLSVFTFSIYNLFWLFINLNRLKGLAVELSQARENDAPHVETARTALRLKEAGTLDSLLSFANVPVAVYTVLFAIPVVNLIALMSCAARFVRLIPGGQTSKLAGQATLVGFFLALSYGALSLLYKLPSGFFLLYLSNCLPLILMQTWINRHWKVVEANKCLTRQAFTPIELVAIIIGASLLGLIVVNLEIVH